MPEYPQSVGCAAPGICQPAPSLIVGQTEGPRARPRKLACCPFQRGGPFAGLTNRLIS